MSNLITDEYLELNEKLHSINPEYGTSGQKWVGFVMDLCNTLNTKDVLDYGCGKSTLAMQLPFTIKQYDPAIPRYSDQPDAADVVVCTDVLEHIEPDLIDNVLEDISEKTKVCAFFSIALTKAKKILEDGRNAHLIVESPKWWAEKLWKYFDITNFNRSGNEILVICRKEGGKDA